MNTPQPGIFALGTSAHRYLEWDVPADRWEETRAAIREITAEHTGVNIVVGIRPSRWERDASGVWLADLHDFEYPVTGDDGFTMPATQHDLAVWIAARSESEEFDATVTLVAAVREAAEVLPATDVRGWTYHENRDLTGFEDGTENPAGAEAAAATVDPETGASVLLLQQWEHRSEEWAELTDEAQEAVIGRTKPDSVELEDRPETSHVARTDQEDAGDIFRRNTAYGSPTNHGTMFVGFAAHQEHLQTMLVRMAGCAGEPRDALTRFSTPLTGSYYLIPPLELL